MHKWIAIGALPEVFLLFFFCRFPDAGIGTGIIERYGNTVTTDTATISLPHKDLKILSQPTDVYAAKGVKYRVAFQVQGTDLSYQWYYKAAGTNEFMKSINQKAAYAYTMQSGMDGRQIYCVITDEYGEQVTTDTVTLHMVRK